MQLNTFYEIQEGKSLVHGIFLVHQESCMYVPHITCFGMLALFRGAIFDNIYVSDKRHVPIEIENS